ncbi:MAG: hypothetical protein IJ308_05120 [Clostridia bacterium]|nr:hypothetical protein [Clostridia bacterium]MBQ7913104.1 hypothetical protein [Clostridia bacterium]
MILLYILLIAYIIAVNFYAFLLVKSLRDKEKQDELNAQAEPLLSASENAEQKASSTSKLPLRPTGRLYITGALGGAITIYVCMFLFKYKRTDLLLMVLMPLLGVLNVYLWVLLFRSGLSFFVIR